MPAAQGGLAACLANHQSAGRGRGGKQWHAPPGYGLLLSLGRATAKPPDSSLALALGVAMAEALEAFAVSGSVGLKWPNDLIANQGKLGGILVESVSRPGAGTLIVAGLGVNIRVSGEQRKQVAANAGLAPVGLSELPRKRKIERHSLAAGAIAAMADVLEKHPQEGFAPWREGWKRRDWLFGRQINALSTRGSHRGEAAGVDLSGALLLNAAGGRRRILAAEIRL